MTPRRSSWLRFSLAVVLLSSVALFLRARSSPETLPPREALSDFPMRVDDWVGRNVPLDPQILEVLGAGEFLMRDYQRFPAEPPLNLFVAYFPSQRTGSTIHSPQNCLPGAGWTFTESGHLQLTWPGGETFDVNQVSLAKGLDRLSALYWYQAHGRIVASEYSAKFYLVADAIRMHRTDGALVRIITPVGRGETAGAAQRRAVQFAERIVLNLHRYIPQ